MARVGYRGACDPPSTARPRPLANLGVVRNHCSRSRFRASSLRAAGRCHARSQPAGAATCRGRSRCSRWPREFPALLAFPTSAGPTASSVRPSNVSLGRRAEDARPSASTSMKPKPAIEIVPFESPMAGACERILKAVPEWFGIPASNEEYVRSPSRLTTFVARLRGVEVGFVALEQQFPESAENHVLTDRSVSFPCSRRPRYGDRRIPPFSWSRRSRMTGR